MNKKLIRISIILGVFIAISVALFFILRAFGITDVDYLRNVIAKTGSWAIIVYVALRVVLTLFFCFIPSHSMIFDLIAVGLFGANWRTFVICVISLAICSTIMYLLGRFGANKFIERVIGKEDMEKGIKLIKEKGYFFYPFIMVLGGFPDDAVVCAAGVIKMNLFYFIPATVIGRAVGCATTIFGLALIPFDTFTRPYDWFIFICCLLVALYLIIKSGLWCSKRIENYHKKKERSEEDGRKEN